MSAPLESLSLEELLALLPDDPDSMNPRYQSSLAPYYGSWTVQIRRVVDDDSGGRAWIRLMAEASGAMRDALCEATRAFREHPGLPERYRPRRSGSGDSPT